jgi:hypothetical protein
MPANPYQPPKEVGSARLQRAVWVRIAFVLGAVLLVGWLISTAAAFFVVSAHYQAAGQRAVYRDAVRNP